jgi:hypothetical protein
MSRILRALSSALCWVADKMVESADAADHKRRERGS